MQDNHKDILGDLNNNQTIQNKLLAIHQPLIMMYPFIHRIAIALYDDKSELFKTYLSSSESESPLIHYESKLDDAPSLKEIIKSAKPRVINDLAILNDGIHEHTIKIKNHGYQASYTLPIYQSEKFLGFIFFNSLERDCFNSDVLNILDVYGHLISSQIIFEIATIKSMLAALRTANEMVHFRDPETGNHLERMSRFSRIIAKELSKSAKYNFDDKFVEDIFIYAPLHDVGKISIPDEILLKPARLDKKEFETMKKHAQLGKQVIESIIRNFEFESFANIDILRNIVHYHHEALDGSGYPEGLKNENIPIESKITAVADIFDALTSRRPYKEAWTNEEAFDLLKKMTNDKLDHDCVEALYNNRDQVEKVQVRFREEDEK